MYHAVMKIQTTFEDKLGNTYTLPKGSFYIPVFEDENEAVEHANDGKFEIVLMRKGYDNE